MIKLFFSNYVKYLEKGNSATGWRAETECQVAEITLLSNI